MSTNCGIAIKAGETYQTIYCHWDGYPSYMLPMLREHYGTRELAGRLVNLGDASCICEKLEPTGKHDFHLPETDVSVFYHRDRGDSWESCRSVCYIESELFRQSAFEYVYIFEDDQWFVYKNKQRLSL